ncbi:MAG: GAF domain-containing protein [Nitrospirae bacterium]|nr:GAF domain-containing protein [Nitrospirota bacterium]
MNKPLQILFVEDSEQDTEIVVHHLRKAGIDPRWDRVESSENFTTALKARPWDVVLADYTMPHFSGTEALSILKESGLQTPLIFISGTIGEETAVAAMRMGAADYVTKANLTRLLPAIERELRETEFRRERKRAEGWSDFLTEAGRVLVESLDYDATLHSIIHLAEKRIADWCAIYRLDDEGRLNHLWVPRDDPEKDALARELHGYAPTVTEESHPVVHALRSGQPMLIPEIPAALFEQTARDARHLELMRKANARTAMHVPLTARGHTFGVVTFVGGPSHCPYSEGDLGRAREFAAHAALAIDNARLFAEAEKARKDADEARRQMQRDFERLATLREVNRAISANLDPHAVLNVLLEESARVLGFPTVACICLVNPESGKLEPAALRGLEEKGARRHGLESPHCHCHSALGGKNPVFVANVQTDPSTLDRDLFERKGLVSCIGIPLEAQEEPLGVLSVYTFSAHAFSKAEVDLLSSLASEAGMVIRNSRLYEKVSRQADDLLQANRVQSEFLSFMSHELRTPLTALIGYAKMLREGLLGSITTNQQTALAKIMRYAGDLHAMISSILEATRIETGGARAESRDVSLRIFMEDLRAAYSTPLAKEIDLGWHYPEDLPTIRTDALKLRHIFQNLVDNAVKYTDKGHVAVALQHFPDERKIQLTVADTGIGIPSEDRPHIFDMFRQAERQHDRSRGGVGMGLYIVRKFVDLLGGTVDVQSEPGRGSTFTVTLPTEPPPQD